MTKQMITNANEILFRSSGISQIMTNPKERSDSEKYYEALSRVEIYKKEYLDMANKGTKTAMNKHAQILKLNTLILQLEKTKDDVSLSETCRKQLLRIYAQEAKGRREELKNKFLDKGNERENDAITLVSIIMKRFYKKNEERLKNEFISGVPDLFDGEDIFHAEETLDTKCSWSLITFLEAQEKELNDAYDWQGQGYMWLTGAKKHTVLFCLVNGTYQYLTDQLRSLGWKNGVLDSDISQDEEFIKAAQQLERNHIFDIDSFMKENPMYEPKSDVWFDKEKDKYFWEFDIPKEERVHAISFMRDEDMIERIKGRVLDCRKYLNKHYFNVS